MNLGDLWVWEKRKLGCRIRVETQNPALDEIRERLSKLSAVEIPQLGSPVSRSKDTTRTCSANAPLSDTRHSMIASSMASLVAYQQDAHPKEISKTRKNIYKKFFQVPRSPPAKIMLDLQKDRLPPPIPSKREGVNSLLLLDTQQKSRVMTRAPKHNDPSGTRSDETGSPNDKEVISSKSVIPPYSGDLFMTRGVYMGGIIYQSRLSGLAGSQSQRRKFMKHKMPSVEETPTTDDAQLELDEGSAAKVALAANSNHAPDAHEAKLHCAISLAAWSINSENTARLAEEGAVSAVLMLSKDESMEVRRACASSFRSMSQHANLCEQLVRLSAVPIISDLGVSSKSTKVPRDCALSLVNLSLVCGIEAKLVEDGIVIALMSIMNQHEELAELCSRGLFNLTCVDQPYVLMERVIKAFVSLASSTLPAVKHVCAAALCNLSDIRPIRTRIVEEGVIQVVGILARGAEAKTRRVCAIILHSLASTRSCRADMVSKGAVQVVYALSSDVDMITLHYISSAIFRLAMEEQNLPRLVHEGGVTALCNICLRCPRDILTTQLCASALSLLSQQTIGRYAVVQEGCVPALVTLLHEASDSSTLRHGLLTLSNLLLDTAHHVQVLGQGGVAAIILLSNHKCSEIRESCAIALFNFSRGEAASEKGVSASAIPAIIALSRLPQPRTRMRCAATLCKLASVEDNVNLMVEEGVVPAFIDMLQTRDQGIVKHCCAALCRLAHVGSSAVTIAKGALPHVIAGCSHRSDATTRQSCCAVLSAVSADEPCRQLLCSMGTLQALVSLAKDRTADGTTQLRCAVAFANLSSEVMVQREMVLAGIVPVVAELSNSYCEENQLYCARVLCNLGCCNGSEEAIVKQGGVAALMMICMVRAVSHLTKQICAKALQNLVCTPQIQENWLPFLAKEGLVQAVSVLSRLPEEETMRICASIFCTLSSQGCVGRQILVERRSTLKDIFSLMRSTKQTTKVVCGMTACNLLGYENSQRHAIGAGAMSVLQTLSTLGDPEAEIAAADAYFLISGGASARQEMVDSLVLPSLINNALSQNIATRRSYLRTLAYLAWWSELRVPLLEAGILPMLVSVVDNSGSTSSIEEDDLLTVQDLTLHIITYLTFVSEAHLMLLINDPIIPALEFLFQSSTLSKNAGRVSRVRMFVAAAVRSLVSATGALDKLVKDGVCRLLCRITCADARDSSCSEYVHCVIAYYAIVRERLFNDALMDQGILEALPKLGRLTGCHVFTAAILHILCLEPQHRELIAVDVQVRSLFFRLAEEGVPCASTVQSCAQSLVMLSRCNAHIREELATSGFVPLLIRMTRHDDEKVASACLEALKNLSSGGSDGLKEGAVSTLIAMALSSGKTGKSASLDPDSLAELPLSPLIDCDFKPVDYMLPGCSLATFKPHTMSIIKMVGGIAGVGPPPPEPPEMELQDDLDFLNLETVDAIEDDEHMGASMIFAKMAP